MWHLYVLGLSKLYQTTLLNYVTPIHTCLIKIYEDIGKSSSKQIQCVIIIWYKSREKTWLLKNTIPVNIIYISLSKNCTEWFLKKLHWMVCIFWSYQCSKRDMTCHKSKYWSRHEEKCRDKGGSQHPHRKADQRWRPGASMSPTAACHITLTEQHVRKWSK